jgi:hypothetical protein
MSESRDKNFPMTDINEITDMISILLKKPVVVVK